MVNLLRIKTILGDLLAQVALVTLITLLVPSGFATASNSSVTILANYQEGDLVVLDLADASEISTLDPAMAADMTSITPIENLFHGLTDTDPITSQVVPEIATSWEVSEDGLTWTFNLRDDVMWYQFDPATNTATEMRPVVATDFVYGIKRACDPRLARYLDNNRTGYYGEVAARVIAGCDLVNKRFHSDVTDELVFGDTTQVSAPDNATVVINLQFPAGYFSSMTSMWMLRAVPQEAIEVFGEEWTTPGNIITNGPFFVKEVTRGVRRVFVRNKLHNPDLDYGGNIDVISTTVIEDSETVFALYQDNQLDTSGVPATEIQNILEDPEYADQLRQVFSTTVFYFGYAHNKAPFNNVHVRRAFSAIIDRNVFVEQVLQGRGVPMIHFTPPGIVGAPPINEVGVGFDPDFANAEMEAAGYANCEGFPEINIVTFSGASNWGRYWVAAAEEYLGCSPDVLTIQSIEFSLSVEVSISDIANAWTLGWGPDYGDANNWVNDVLSCEGDNAFLRPCTEVDDLIEQAARENDPAIRKALYTEIEEGFFGPEGEFPINPLYMRSSFQLVKSWYTGPFDTDGLYGGQHWDTRNLDMAAKTAARG